MLQNITNRPIRDSSPLINMLNPNTQKLQTTLILFDTVNRN